MSEHSPTPWKRGTDGLIFDAENEYVTDTCGTSLPEGEENQKLIVRAVNSHNELVKACRKAEGLLLETPLHEKVESAIEALQAVIAKAGGKSP